MSVKVGMLTRLLEWKLRGESVWEVRPVGLIRLAGECVEGNIRGSL